MQSSSNRIQSLDILRGIAILLVIVHHAGPEMIPNQPETSGMVGFIFWSIKNLGWSGVDLFFVLSGFLIGGLLFSEIEKTGSLQCGRFWLRRGFKIWPSYFALLFVLAWVDEVRWIDLEHLGQGVRDLVVHGLFLQNYLDRGVNGPTWSLAVEEHFYLFLPLLLTGLHLGHIGRPIPAARYHAFFIVALFSGLIVRSLHVLTDAGPQVNDFMLTHFRFDSLILGVALQYYRRNNLQEFSQLLQKYRWPLLMLAGLLLLPALFYSRNDALMFSIGFSGLSLGYAILLAMVLQFGFGQGRVQASLEPVAIVGRWSYNVYLWHYFLPFLVPGYWSLQEQIGNLPAPGPAVLMLQVLVYAALSVAIGAVITRWVENPALAYRDRWCPSRAMSRNVGSSTGGNAGVAQLSSRLPNRTSARP